MDQGKGYEEKLREAACFGDDEAVRKLVDSGVNVNAQHEINGWTALHWATKRGHPHIVSYLVHRGADRTVLTKKGELAASLTDREDILKIFGESGPIKVEDKPLPIVPNYLAYPPINYKVDIENSTNISQTPKQICAPNVATHAAAMPNGIGGGSQVTSTHGTTAHGQLRNDELVLKVRIAHTPDPDYIEVELPNSDLSYSRLLRVCCEELGVDPSHVFKIRKLPDTILRKDKDVQRLGNFQELELVLSNQKCLDSRYSISPFSQNNLSPPTTKSTFLSSKIFY